MNNFTIFILATLIFYSLALQVNHIQSVTARGWSNDQSSYGSPYSQSQTTMRTFPWSTNNATSTYYMNRSITTPPRRSYGIANGTWNYSAYGDYKNNRSAQFNATRPSWIASNQTRLNPFSQSGTTFNTMNWGKGRQQGYKNGLNSTYTNQFNQNSQLNQWNRPTGNQTLGFGQSFQNALSSVFQGAQNSQSLPSTAQANQGSFSFSNIPQWISGGLAGLKGNSTGSTSFSNPLTSFSNPLTIPGTLLSKTS